VLTFAARETLPNTPPVPIGAQIELPSGDFVVTFDQALHTQDVDPASINFRLDLLTITTLTAHAEGNTVTGTTSNVVGPAGPDVVNYPATPPDVRSKRLILAPAFFNFPLATV